MNACHRVAVAAVAPCFAGFGLARLNALLALIGSLPGAPTPPRSDSSRPQVARLHATLRPHLLRRVIKDVERSLPPKSEHILRVGMTPLQAREGGRRIQGIRSKFTRRECARLA